MAKFTFGKTVDIHWNGYEIVGPALTEFSIPDQLYEEFEGDFREIEPSLTWTDTNEFATLSASVAGSALSATAPIALTTTSTGKTISFSSNTALNGYLLAANGTGGTIWTPASTSSLTSVIGIAPISTVISGGTVSVSIDTASLNTGNAETLRTYVKNSTGSTITKGQVVYITGADGTNALIGLATSTTEAGSSKTLGIAASTMTNNAFGYVTESGQLSNIDTSAATAGSSVWLGTTPGSYVFNSPPAKPSNNVYLGVVTKANVSTGEILVKVQNGYELDELHDVSATNPTNLDIIQWNSTGAAWTATSLTNAGIVTPTGTQTLTNKTLTLPLINNTNGDYTTQVTAAATTYTLTASSTRVQYFTGTTSGTTVSLPSTATLTVGHSYELHNNATGVSIVVSTSTAGTLVTMTAGLSYRITCISTANNATTSWDVELFGTSTSTGSGASVLGTSPTISSPSISGPTITGTATMTSAAIVGLTFINTAGYSAIATAAGTTSISNTGRQYLKFTGSTTQFANLPSTGSIGLEYRILNTSTGAVTLRSSDLSTVAVLQQNQSVRVILNTLNGTTAASWDVEWLGAPTSTGTGSTVYSASPTLTGDVTINAQGDLRFADADSSNWVALQAPATVASNVTLTLPSADGTSGQALTTNGSGALAFASISGATVSTFTASGTYTVPASATMFYVYAVGGGGSGAGGARSVSNNTNGGGGSGGLSISRLFRSIDISGSTVAVTIGAGGISVAGSSTSVPTVGNNGNVTSFGTNLLTALGGLGATADSRANSGYGTILTFGSTPNGDGATRGAAFGPGSGGNGADTSAGGNQTAGQSGFGTHTVGVAGNGGTVGTNGATPTAGGNGLTYGAGGGGGGCSTTTTTVAGGAGGNGAVPGGGGGGGGTARASGSTANGGAGGAGGDGILIVVAW